MPRPQLFAACALLLLAALPARGGATEAGRAPLRDLWRAGRVTLTDTGRVYGAPLHLDRRAWLKAGGLLALGGLLLANDESIHAEIRRGSERGPLKPLIEFGEFIEPAAYQGNTNAAYVGGLLLGYAFDWELLRDTCARILEGHLVTGIAKNGANLLVGRRRPFEALGAYEFEPNGGTSFPSGHAVTMLVLTEVLAERIDHPLADLALGAGAVCLCLQRVASDNHWPSDVYAGALIGLGTTRVLLAQERARGGMSARLVPLPAGLAIVGNF